MKIYQPAFLAVVFIAGSFITGSDAASVLNYKDKIFTLLTNLKANMGTNSNLLGLELPPLDPLDIVINSTLSLDLNGVAIDIYIDELKATGLKEFVIDRYDAYVELNGTNNAIYIPVRLFVPSLTASATYELELLNLNGMDEPLKLSVGDIILETNIKIKFGDENGNDILHLYLQDLGLKLDLGWIHIDVGNALGDKELGEVVNALLDDLIPQVLKMKEQDIFDLLLTTVKKLLDGKLTLKDLLNI